MGGTAAQLDNTFLSVKRLYLRREVGNLNSNDMICGLSALALGRQHKFGELLST